MRHKRLEEDRKSDWRKDLFLEAAAASTILAAHRAWADKNGIHTELYPPAAPSKTPPPSITRNF